MSTISATKPSLDRRYRGRLYGLSIDSALDLNARRPQTTAPTDLRVELGAPLAVQGDAPEGELQVHWSTHDGLRASFVRETSGCHRLRFQATCEITIDPSLSCMALHMATGVPQEMGAVLIGGTVLSYLLLLHNRPVLHASAVQIGDSAIGFVGSSGMGKTTLATLLCRAGGTLITDDVLRLTHGDDEFRCHLGATELRLRKAAAELASSFGDSGTQRTTADDRRALSVPIATDEDLPLKVLIVPRPRHDLDEIELTRLDPRNAAIALLKFPRILGVSAPTLQAQQFVHMTDIAQTVPMFIADVPWGPPFANDLPARLIDQITTVAAI